MESEPTELFGYELWVDQYIKARQPTELQLKQESDEAAREYTRGLFERKNKLRNYREQARGTDSDGMKEVIKRDYVYDVNRNYRDPEIAQAMRQVRKEKKTIIFPYAAPTSQRDIRSAKKLRTKINRENRLLKKKRIQAKYLNEMEQMNSDSDSE
ncbi:hypothetical protein EIN_376720 [Entamoeba invadens IP1]|uniref:Ribosomal RNA-processing protein 7 C-terminal domain-containing protein n=1 Tax=Entamoeba invadens IP1 TaxID=370355 RepID=A0A0A1TU64_ENTIV|nr:hypothetical protein EIN_376720 [Entamoeba invadens IP1]ELP83487.1 hypothetical protein EIN_376720 [Entamoeba invadens IP1]|eukprot:XP_004182833.1 hypothetical protein EIN_376720 [Entamoeba invadens IP1]